MSENYQKFSRTRRQSVNKSANMYFHSQSSCKILVYCLKFKQDVRCIMKLDCAEGCVCLLTQKGQTAVQELHLRKV